MATDTYTPSADLQAMFDRAEKEGLWFYASYQGLWFSPSELREQQEHGKFRWGAPNWQLRTTQEALEELDREIGALRTKRERLTERIYASTKGGGYA